METLYSQLSALSRNGRQELTRSLIKDMALGQQYAANIAFSGLCKQIIAAHRGARSETVTWDKGQLSAAGSVALADKIPRVSGYLTAIQRASEVRTAIDAGTGASALLAIGIAACHPNTQVAAHESNAFAAACAEEVTQLTGFDDRIKVIGGDVMAATMDAYDLATTETFGPALIGEPGPAISHHIGTNARQLVPSTVKIYATNELEHYADRWQHVSTLNLRDANPYVEGSFRATNYGRQPVYVQSRFYGEHGFPILDQSYQDRLTDAVLLGEVDVPRIGARINFRYETGLEYEDSPPELST